MDKVSNMTLRPLLIAVLSIIFIVGIWQTGHGAWIYVKAELAQYLLQQAWAKTLEDNQPVPPWPWADTWPIAKLIVPRQNIEMFVLSGASGRTLAFGPGHVSSSALPGKHGTAIFNGHRDTHFKFLQNIQSGDSILIEATNGETIRFTVYDMKIVDARHTIIRHDDSTPQLVLMTCYPFDAMSSGGHLRYVVSGIGNNRNIHVDKGLT